MSTKVKQCVSDIERQLELRRSAFELLAMLTGSFDENTIIKSCALILQHTSELTTVQQQDRKKKPKPSSTDTLKTV